MSPIKQYSSARSSQTAPPQSHCPPAGARHTCHGAVEPADNRLDVATKQDELADERRDSGDVLAESGVDRKDDAFLVVVSEQIIRYGMGGDHL